MNERQLWETDNYDEAMSPTHEIGNDDCPCEVCTIIRNSGLFIASGPVVDADVEYNPYPRS